jgi:chromosome partitioning protein
MAAVITVMNMKGGVGKTTVTMNVGGLLGRQQVDGVRRKVLLIDYDPQFNLSQAFIKPKRYYALENARKTTLAILQDDESHPDPYKLQVPGNVDPPSVKTLAFEYYSRRGSKLDIIPSTMDLMYIALGQSSVRISPMEERFKKFIEECKRAYDLIFIDCHPAGSVFTKTALQNSDHVVIPVVPERFAVRGIGLMIQFIRAQKHGASIPQPHILFNLTGTGPMSPSERRIRTDKNFKDHCMTEALRKFKAFGDPEGGDGFVWSSSKPWSTQAYFGLVAVTRELLTRTGL